MMEDCDKLVAELEKKELEAVGGEIGPELYCKLLALYLYQNDLCNAKFLWKRIPENVKSETPELGKIWNVWKAMWSRDALAIYKAIENEWSENVDSIMTALVDVIREHYLNLISTAYTSVTVANLSTLLGMSLTDAISHVTAQRQWIADQTFVYPVKSSTPTTSQSTAEDQLNILTNFVSILEN